MRVDEVANPLPFHIPANEVSEFLMGFALDFDARERLDEDKDAFLQECDLSDEARSMLSEPTANTFLGRIHATEVALALIVLVLETVTTDIIVL